MGNETFSTVIKFVAEAVNPAGGDTSTSSAVTNATATSDMLFLPIIIALAAVAFAGLAFWLYAQKKKANAIAGAHSNNYSAMFNQNNLSTKKILAIVVVAFALVASVAIPTTHALADATTSATTTPEVNAKVNPDTGAVAIDYATVTNTGTTMIAIDGLQSVGTDTLKNATFEVATNTGTIYSATIGQEKAVSPWVTIKGGESCTLAFNLKVDPEVAKTLVGQEMSLKYSIDNVSTLSGTVVDADGNPVAGATAAFENAGGSKYSATTDATGVFSLLVLAGDAGTLTISKDGIGTQTITLTAEELKTDYDVGTVQIGEEKDGYVTFKNAPGDPEGQEMKYYWKKIVDDPGDALKTKYLYGTKSAQKTEGPQDNPSLILSGFGSFYYNNYLVAFAPRSTVTDLQMYCLDGCRKLETIALNEGLTDIYYDAICTCDSLTSIKIPKSVKHINNGAIRYNTNLTSVSYEGTIAEFKAILENAPGRKMADIFQGCGRVTKVTCSDGDYTDE